MLLLLLLMLLPCVQVSGQAQYTDDVPLPPDALHAAFVTSNRPHARILKVRF
jgi:xanthine dehydrogenase/oxidase